MWKILGVTWPRPRPLWGKFLHISIQVCQYLPVWQIRSVYNQYFLFRRRYNVKPRTKMAIAQCACAVSRDL